jgi:hypothetical protein
MFFIDVATPVLLMNGYYGMGGYGVTIRDVKNCRVLLSISRHRGKSADENRYSK